MLDLVRIESKFRELKTHCKYWSLWSEELFNVSRVMDIHQLYVLQLLKKIHKGKIVIQQQDHNYETRHNQKHQRTTTFKEI